MKRTIETLAKAVVPNGRWGDHHISVERVSDEFGTCVLYRDGFSDPLQCDEADAMRFFNERLVAA